MSSKIFKSTFLTSMLVLVVSFAMIFSVLFDYFENRVFSELESEAKYISYAIEDGAEEFLRTFENEDKRITLISPAGEVLADTKADTDELENHADREEIREALKSGTGKSSRYSDTLTEKTLYYAVKTKGGNILRVSAKQNSVFTIMMGLLQPIVWIVVTALAVSLFLSYKIADSVMKPINSIDLDNPEDSAVYDELIPLLKKLSAQKKTIRNQIKEAEKSSEEFRLICENMKEGFLVTDKNGKVLSHNGAALKLLGIEKARGESILNYNRTKNFREVVQKALDGSRGESTESIGERTYNFTANPVYLKGKNIGAVIVIIDITESAKREQLRREFTANVSHELKTPLTSISGFAEIMKEGDVPQKTVTDFSNAIYTEAQRLIGLVSDIMKISELDEEKIGYEKENTDLYELSLDIKKRLTPLANLKNVTLNVTGGKAFVYGNRKILDEMVYNLCDNAVKYNKENGRVDIIVTSNEEETKITVRDTGIGIAPKDRERVFERFYRVDKSRSKANGGTGLGLAIVKHGAQYHNAKIALSSEENKGTGIELIFEKCK